MTAINRDLAARVAELGIPLTADRAPLSDVREAEIREHVATTKNFSLGNLAARDLLTELDRTRTELAKYVGKEPTIAEEMAYLGRCLDAVHDLCGEQEKAARLFEIPVPEWVETVRRVADGGAR